MYGAASTTISFETTPGDGHRGLSWLGRAAAGCFLISALVSASVHAAPSKRGLSLAVAGARSDGAVRFSEAMAAYPRLFNSSGWGLEKYTINVHSGTAMGVNSFVSTFLCTPKVSGLERACV